MRLIHASTLLFEEFWGESTPKYAILSHRWETEEVSYREWRKATKNGHFAPHDPLRSKKGFQKIHHFCQVALQNEHQYVWVDTCCIDKSSSAELQESINSMFRWYRDAQVCYAYLCDWPPNPNETTHRSAGRNQVACSEWFTRGWTLQELLAPAAVVFLDRDWRPCGNRNDVALALEISAATDIRAACLCYSPDTDPATRNLWVSVWERMSWASNRKTARIEDRAYSLLGLFDIHMPMLYGEAEQAFSRLQEEIIKAEEDCSILAWSALPHDRGFASCGLACSPDHFFLHNTFAQACRPGQFELSPLTMIQRGLQVPLLVRRDVNDPSIGYVILHKDHARTYYLVLPILFSKGDLYSFVVENECARISDPVLVPSGFMAKAKRKHICFLREPLGLHPDIPMEIRLKHHVWRNFEVTFTYPPQLQKGRQSFPILLGKFNSSHKQQTGALVIAIRNRANDNRYLVIAQYRILKQQVTDISVRVTKYPFEMTLPKAEALVHRLHRSLEPCDLYDDRGRRIHHTEFLEIRQNDKFWLDGSDDEFTENVTH
jgi:hypothetical protein